MNQYWLSSMARSFEMKCLTQKSLMATALFGAINIAALVPAMAQEAAADAYEQQQFREDDRREKEEDDRYKDDRNHKERVHSNKEEEKFRLADPCNKYPHNNPYFVVKGYTTVTITAVKGGGVLVKSEFKSDKKRYSHDVEYHGQKKFDKPSTYYEVPIRGNAENDERKTEFDFRGIEYIKAEKGGYYPTDSEVKITKIYKCERDEHDDKGKY
jgi:hypothetical protein